MYKTQVRVIQTLCIVIFLASLMIFYLLIDVRHLNSENAKFKQEIEYLVETKEMVIKDNQDMQDRFWNWNQDKMKEDK